ncbi:MAG TPA: hypothetical protein VLY24_02575 [Bryobacteraceae bacterium]|nr:hypothetical protein [Bryobacteraceae bacterium]
MLNETFLDEFKRVTEAMWRRQEIDPRISGFQFQRGTRWNPGLTNDQVAEYESAISVRFPLDFKMFLQVMNGTDLPTLNVYAHCGEPPRESAGVYCYPRDLEIVKRRINEARQWRTQLAVTLSDQGFELGPESDLMPFYIHRYVVCTADLDSTVVLSIADGEDAIVYGESLQKYLEREFLDAGH